MKDLFNRIFKVSLLSSIMFLVFGILLIVKTDSVIKTVSIAIGTILVIIGIIPIINYFKNREQTGWFASASFLYGVFSIVAGFMLIFNTKIIASIVPILAGVWMIVSSVNKIQISMALRDNKNKMWLSTFILAIVILVIGAFFIVNPYEVASQITKTLGIVIAILAVVDIVDCIIIKVKTKDVFKEYQIVAEEVK